MLAATVQGRTSRISRVAPGPASSELGGAFIFIVTEDQARQQHLEFTLNHFLGTEQECVLLKRYQELQVKKYFNFLGAEDNVQ